MTEVMWINRHGCISARGSGFFHCSALARRTQLPLEPPIHRRNKANSRSKTKTVPLASSMLAVLLLANLCLNGCAPIPVETKPNPLEVHATSECAGVHLDDASFQAADNKPFVQNISTEILKIKDDATIVPGQDFMKTVFPGRNSATVKELSSKPTVDHIREMPITHVVLIDFRKKGGETHGKVTAVATLISINAIYRTETLSFGAEEYRAGISLPLPYIFLFFPYSDSDVSGIAAGKISDALSNMILSRPDEPLRLAILKSDNLADLVARPHALSEEIKSSSHPEDVVKRWRNPLNVYSDIMSSARDDGSSFYYNPLAHVQMLLTSVVVAPTMVVTDVLIDVIDGRGDSGQPNVLTSREADWQQFGYAKDAIKRKDWQAGYRLLEDFIATDDEMLKERTLRLFEEYPKLLAAAQETFSNESLEASRIIYGSSAITIERKRLELYEIVAMPDAYSRAHNNFIDVFGTEEQSPQAK